MKIDEKMLSIPPYISTSWNHIRALYAKGNLIVVILVDGDTINIPGLNQDIVEKIFTAHAAFLELDASTSPSSPLITPSSGQTKPISPLNFLQSLGEVEGNEGQLKFAFGAFEGMGTVMQHNSNQANTPDLPPEVLSKVSAIAKIVAPEDINLMPKAEPHCNCLHCQIARAIQGGLISQETLIEDAVSDEELEFQEWEIRQEADKLFNVINRLDNKLQYHVYLGDPIGCTCGHEGCDHIIAVLKT